MSDISTDLLQRRNLASLVLVNLGVGTHAIVWFMVVTAMPSVVAELQAEPYLSWATSVYLVSSIVGGATMALLKARFGSRLALLASALVVTAGGLLAAAAPGIALVLGGRVLQGLGEGVLVALSYALVRELFDIRIVPRVFGIQAVTWGFAIFIGPLAGGWLTEAGTWRAAFVGTALLPLPLLVLAGWVLPDIRGRTSRQAGPATTASSVSPVSPAITADAVQPAAAAAPTTSSASASAAPSVGPATTLPGLRLLLLVAGVMAIAVANRMPDAGSGLAAVTLGLALIGAMLALDRRSAQHMFPIAFPGFAHPVALGLWVLLLMPLAQMAIYVYTPYILQLHRGLSPTWAGYFGAVHAVAWSTSAVLVGPLTTAAQNRALQCGPLLLALGLAGLAITLPAQPLPWVVVSMLLVGTGFGISYAFLNQRVMAAAEPGQEDATTGAAPTLGSLGGAVGAAIGGLAANPIGLNLLPLTTPVVTQAAWLLSGGGAVLALVAAGLARRLLRQAGA